MNIKDLILYRLERAKEAIIEAENMANISHWNSCVNRLYYACFYAVSALLISKNLSSSKHTGIRALFNKHLVKTNIIPKKYGEHYNHLYIYRQQSDYEDFFRMEESKVKPWIALSKDFVDFIESTIINQKKI